MLILPSPADTPALANEAGRTITDVGRIFGQGGPDGLVLFALILAALMLFVPLIVMLVINSRERTAASKDCTSQALAFAEAARLGADANKDLATAIASSASANMTFQQTLATRLERFDDRMREMEDRARRRDRGEA